MASASVLALSLLLRSSTGLPSGFSQVLENIPVNRLKLVSQQLYQMKMLVCGNQTEKRF